MIKEWLFKRILEKNIVFLKNNGNKEYFLVKNIVFDDGDFEVVIFESQKVEKKNINEIRTG